MLGFFQSLLGSPGASSRPNSVQGQREEMPTAGPTSGLTVSGSGENVLQRYCGLVFQQEAQLTDELLRINGARLLTVHLRLQQEGLPKEILAAKPAQLQVPSTVNVAHFKRRILRESGGCLLPGKLHLVLPEGSKELPDSERLDVLGVTMDAELILEPQTDLQAAAYTSERQPPAYASPAHVKPPQAWPAASPAASPAPPAARSPTPAPSPASPAAKRLRIESPLAAGPHLASAAPVVAAAEPEGAAEAPAGAEVAAGSSGAALPGSSGRAAAGAAAEQPPRSSAAVPFPVLSRKRKWDDLQTLALLQGVQQCLGEGKTSITWREIKRTYHVLDSFQPPALKDKFVNLMKAAKSDFQNVRQREVYTNEVKEKALTVLKLYSASGGSGDDDMDAEVAGADVNGPLAAEGAAAATAAIGAAEG